jgi:hypothetical protein
MQFPEPTVDIEAIKQEYHAIVAAEGRESPAAGKKGKKKKKGRKANKK